MADEGRLDLGEGMSSMATYLPSSLITSFHTNRRLSQTPDLLLPLP